MDRFILVRDVVINGMERSNRKFVERQFDPVKQCVTVDCVRCRLETAKQYLKYLNMFKDIECVLRDRVLNVNVKENRFRLFAGTDWIGDNELAIKVQGTWFNVFGRGEQLNGDVQYGKSKPVNLTFTRPFISNPNNTFNWTIFNTQVPEEWRLGGEMFCDLWRGVVRHRIKYSLFRRSSLDGHQQAVRSSIIHDLLLDKRDDSIVPTSGYYVKMMTELAGFGGVEKFLKNETHFSRYLKIMRLIFSFGIRGRFQNPFGRWEIGAVDKYFVGGPFSVRGFHSKGIVLGKDETWTKGQASVEGSLSCLVPLGPPGFANDSVWGHLFINGGNVSSRFGKDLIVGSGISCGCGVVWRMFGMARLEINTTYPVRIRPGQGFDFKRPHFGFGVEFL